MQVFQTAFVVASCLLIGSAAAEPAPPAAKPAPPAAASQSVLPNVLSTSVGATLDARIDSTHLGPEIPQVFALNLHGQYISPSGFGAYLALPMALYGEADLDEAALGNLELGGLYVIRRGAFEAYLRTGLSLEQTSTEADGVGVVVANAVPRLADMLVAGLGTSWGRAGSGMRLKIGPVAVGSSAGVDFPLGSTEEGDEMDNVLHLSGSIGIAQPRFGLAVGVTMLQPLASAEDNESLVGLEATGDVAVGGKVRLYGAFGLSLDEEAEAYSLGAGMRIRM